MQWFPAKLCTAHASYLHSELMTERDILIIRHSLICTTAVSVEPYVLILNADGTLSGCHINLRNLVVMWTVPGQHHSGFYFTLA